MDKTLVLLKHFFWFSKARCTNQKKIFECQHGLRMPNCALKFFYYFSSGTKQYFLKKLSNFHVVTMYQCANDEQVIVFVVALLHKLQCIIFTGMLFAPDIRVKGWALRLGFRVMVSRLVGCPKKLKAWWLYFDML